MTITETPTTPIPLQIVTFDLYRDIHKGIRSELFAAVTEAGRLDPSDTCGAAALADQVRRTVELLHGHADHEDRAIQPVLEAQLPALAERIAADHRRFEPQLDSLAARAAAAGTRSELHELYIELASFTATYLQHQDVEEREVMPALETVIGVEGVLDVHMQIISGMPPQQLISGLAVMFPAMNVDDRTELLGGMKANAPAEAFAGVWSLARSVLAPADYRAVAARLGLA